MHSNRRRANKEDQWGLLSNAKLCLVMSMLVIFVMVLRQSMNHKTQETPYINELRQRSKSVLVEPDIAGILGRTQAYLSTLKHSLSYTTTTTMKLTSQITPPQQVPSATQSSITSKPHMEPLPSPPKAAIIPSSDTSPAVDSWYIRMTSKLHCLQQSHRGAVYLYHVRKAAGTTIRDLLTQATVRWGVPLYETEGVCLFVSLSS